MKEDAAENISLQTLNCHHDRLLSLLSDLEHMPKEKKNTPKVGQGWNTLERALCVLITIQMIEKIESDLWSPKKKNWNRDQSALNTEIFS